jgi:hypothetical protein
MMKLDVINRPSNGLQTLVLIFDTEAHLDMERHQKGKRNAIALWLPTRKTFHGTVPQKYLR